MQISITTPFIEEQAHLTCNFYGLILPDGDRQWHNTVNVFIARQAEQLQNKWLGEYFPQAVSDLDYCFHKQKN